jgi:hypothetical protein
MPFSRFLKKIRSLLTRPPKLSAVIDATPSSARFAIEPLSKSHDKQDFRCEEESLTLFLHSSAGQHSKIHFSQTYVAVFPDANKVLGYYTLVTSSLELRAMPNAKGFPTGYDRIPAVKLARLARDVSMKGTLLGETLLMSAFTHTVQIAKLSGASVMELDAMNVKVRDSFYSKFGFQPLLDDELHLYLPIKTIRKIVGS